MQLIDRDAKQINPGHRHRNRKSSARPKVGQRQVPGEVNGGFAFLLKGPIAKGEMAGALLAVLAGPCAVQERAGIKRR